MKKPTAKRLESLLNRLLMEEGAKLYRAYTPSNSRAYGCSIAKCPNKAYAKGLCNAHYIRKRNGIDMTMPLKNRKSGAKCSTCGAPIKGKGGWGLCQQHYRVRRRQIIKRTLVKAMGDRCQRCKGSFPDCAYDFHHLDAEEKLHSPSSAFDNTSLRLVCEEVVKCILLCANCHRIEHSAEECHHEHSSAKAALSG